MPSAIGIALTILVAAFAKDFSSLGLGHCTVSATVQLRGLEQNGDGERFRSPAERSPPTRISEAPVNGLASKERRLAQTHGGFDCDALAREFYDENVSLWSVDEKFERQGGLAAAAQCVRDGDRILLSTSNEHTPNETVRISKSSIITTEGFTNDKIGPDPAQKAVLSCPPSGQPLFEIEEESVVLENVVIHNCNLKGQSPAVRIRKGSKVELRNVAFLNNAGGSSLIRLAGYTQLVATRIEARKNSIRIVHASRARVVISDSEFAANRFDNTETGGVFRILQKSVLNVTNSTFDDNSAKKGATVHASGSDANFDNCTFRRNRAEHEGGVGYFVADSLGRFANCTFVSNHADNDAGVVRSEDGKAEFLGCFFQSNTVSNSAACVLAHDGQVTLEQCEFDNNHAMFASVLRSERIQLTVAGCNITNGSGSNTGGVFHLDETPFSISDSTFIGNEAIYGGVMYVHSTAKRSELRDCVFESNVGFQLGGACHFDLGENVELHRVTFAENRAPLGGALYFYDVNVTGSELVFRANNASDGGAIGAMKSDIRISPSPAQESSFGMMTFLNHASNGGGAIDLEESNATVEGASFRFDSGVEGGAVRIQGDVFKVSFRDSDFEVCKAEESGGAVHGRGEGEGRLIFERVSFLGCEAKQAGGAVYLASVDAQFNQCAVRGSRSAAYGGALFLTQSSANQHHVVDISDSVLSDNEARVLGGAICALSAMQLNVNSSEVTNNTALGDAGGGIYVADVNLTLHKTNVTKNGARNGAGVAASSQPENELNSTVAFLESKIRQNTAKDSGGGLLLRSKAVKAVVKGTTFRCNNAKKGGGVALESSVLKGEGVVFRMNKANNSGGGVAVDKASRLLCRSCQFTQNLADEKGGGIFVSYAESCNVSVQLEGCHFEGNNAKFGGGLCYMKKYESQQKCPKRCNATHRVQCGGVVLVGTTFGRNEVIRNGSSVHTNAKDLISRYCRPPPDMPAGKLHFYGTKEIERLAAVRHDQSAESCLSQSTEHGAFSSFARSVVLHAEGLTRTAADPRRYEIWDVVSGQKFGVIRVVPLEATFEELDANLTDWTPAPSIGGDLAPVLDGEPLLLSNLSAAKHWSGTYEFPDFTTQYTVPEGDTESVELTLRFAEEDHLGNVTIAVHLRRCRINEMTKGQGVYCETCSEKSYSFEPTDLECHACPENADCSGRFIIPQPEYWLGSPCRDQTTKCLNPAACDSVKQSYKSSASPNASRTEVLRNFTESLRKQCPVAADMTELFTDMQCSEGYNGVLCGKCSKGLTPTPAYKCVRCPHWALICLVLLFAIVWVVLLVAITIRGNHVPWRALLQALLPRSKAPTKTSTASDAVPMEKGSLEMVGLAQICLEILGSGDMACEKTPSPFLQHPKDSALLTSAEQNAEQSDGTIRDRTTPEQLHREKQAILAKWNVCEIVKIGVNFLQAISIAAAINVEWKQYVLNLFWASDLASGAPVDAVSGGIYCLSDLSGLHPSFVSAISVLYAPLLIAMAFLIFYFVQAAREYISSVEFAKRCLLSFFVIVYFSYLTITRQSALTFFCLSVDNGPSGDPESSESYWTSDTSVACGRGEHRLLQLLSSVFLVVVSVGFPVVCACLYVSYHYFSKTESAGFVYDVMGFMFRGYDSKHGYWEGTVMLRKAALSLIAVFSHDMGGLLQALAAMFVLLVSVTFHTLCKPYREEFDRLNDLEMYSLLFSFTPYLVAAVFSAGDTNDHTKTLSSILLLLVILGFALRMIFVLLTSALEFVKADLRAAGFGYDANSALKTCVCWVSYRVCQKECDELVELLLHVLDKIVTSFAKLLHISGN